MNIESKMDSNKLPRRQRIWRERAKNVLEEGVMYEIDTRDRLGIIRFSREYSLCFWPESNEWTGDVIDTDGNRDLTPEECAELVGRFLS